MDDMWFDLFLHNIKTSKILTNDNHCIRHISFQSIELFLLNRSLTSIILIAKINNLDKINEKVDDFFQYEKRIKNLWKDKIMCKKCYHLVSVAGPLPSVGLFVVALCESADATRTSSNGRAYNREVDSDDRLAPTGLPNKFE